jgi:hypothetical protein
MYEGTCNSISRFLIASPNATFFPLCLNARREALQKAGAETLQRLGSRFKNALLE